MLRLLSLVLLLMLGGLQGKLWYGAGGLDQVKQLDRTVGVMREENAVLRKRNDALAAEVGDLKSGTAAVEERARSELGMIKPGEVFYRVIEAPVAPAPEPRR